MIQNSSLTLASDAQITENNVEIAINKFWDSLQFQVL